MRINNKPETKEAGFRPVRSEIVGIKKPKIAYPTPNEAITKLIVVSDKPFAFTKYVGPKIWNAISVVITKLKTIIDNQILRCLRTSLTLNFSVDFVACIAWNFAGSGFLTDLKMTKLKIIPGIIVK